MPSRNIEIKAKLADRKELDEKVSIAEKLTGQKAVEIIQHDVFFNASNGRLKLRYEGDKAVLIQYSRDSVAGPKLSEFNLLEVSDGSLMEKILEKSIGIMGNLNKTRYLFIHDNKTRLHFDIVENKGTNYYGMEFEVQMKPEESIEDGNKIAEELMKQFELKPEQLLEGSYFEIMNS